MLRRYGCLERRRLLLPISTPTIIDSPHTPRLKAALGIGYGTVALEWFRRRLHILYEYPVYGVDKPMDICTVYRNYRPESVDSSPRKGGIYAKETRAGRPLASGGVGANGRDAEADAQLAAGAA